MEDREKRGAFVFLIVGISSERTITGDFYKTTDALVLMLKAVKE